ncbi:unnamed protein product [Ceutorhynchus assimilis]|uniref:Uncharacterized protein n=1 Tax=Ceutorhynchus assimilis TaxID=467358 RepID=A0A9N9MTQ3_9CUCU|nr:unnamed protein product [Ceutorhynchus assimilis]
MGLLLSILVTCVGVVELLAFYHNVRRRVVYQPVQTGLSNVQVQYFKELEGIRDRLEAQLEQLNNSKSTNLPRFHLTIHESGEDDAELSLAKSRSPTPDITAEFINLEKSKSQECVPEFLNEEHKHTDIFKKKLGHIEVEVDGDLYYRRSPSPFPSYDLTAPRNSVCSELLDDIVSVAEVDEPINAEETYQSGILDAGASAHSSTDYWENKALLVPKRGSRSRSHSPKHKLEAGDALELVNEKVCSEEDEEFVDVVETFTEEKKNSLDGLDKARGCIKKKYVNKRKQKTNKLGSRDNGETKNVNESITGAKPGQPFWVNRNTN